MGEARRRMMEMASRSGIDPAAIGAMGNAGMRQQEIKVDMRHAVYHPCPKCGCKYFTGAIEIATISAIVSPTGQTLMAQNPVLICFNCHEKADIAAFGKEDQQMVDAKEQVELTEKAIAGDDEKDG